MIDPTTIPNIRDDIFNGSLGGRAVLWPGWTLVVERARPAQSRRHALDIVYTTGLEVAFWSCLATGRNKATEHER